MNKLQIEKREEFLNVYKEFNNWLVELGFKNKHTYSHLDHYYSSYNKLIDPLFSVEHYYLEVLNISIRFIRDRNKHVFILTGVLGGHSEIIELIKFKEIILNLVKEERKIKLDEILLINIEL